MSNSIFAVVIVLCGAVIGCFGYGALYAVISASMLEPSVERGMLFGLTYGVTAGAVMAAIFIDAESGQGFTEKLLPRLMAVALVGIALNALFREGAWDVVFEGSNGLAMSTTVMWIGATTWLTREIAANT